jgi:NADH pyrophosphatase NudC (nudix superfamily)
MGIMENMSFMFDQPNLYFVFYLRAESNEIKIQESEIADAKWVPFVTP